MRRIKKVIGTFVFGIGVLAFSNPTSAALPTTADVNPIKQVLYGSNGNMFFNCSWGGGNGSYSVTLELGNGVPGCIHQPSYKRKLMVWNIYIS